MTIEFPPDKREPNADWSHVDLSADAYLYPGGITLAAFIADHGQETARDKLVLGEVQAIYLALDGRHDIAPGAWGLPIGWHWLERGEWVPEPSTPKGSAIWVLGAVTAEGTQKPTAAKPQKASRKREGATQALAALFPNGTALIPDKELHRQVIDWLDERGLPTVDVTTVRRAAGRQ